MKKYSRVSYLDRCQIYAFLEIDLSVPKMAKQLNFNKSTIYREINKNLTCRGKYIPSIAQFRTDLKSKLRVRNPVITHDLKRLIVSKLELGWSPEQVTGRLKKELRTAPSHETIYRFIRGNKEFRVYLRWHNKRGFSRYRRLKMKRKQGLSIHDRPKIINDRKRFGDWERDGMYGANRKQLLICTERKSRYTVLELMPDINSTVVSKLTLKVLKNSKIPFFSVTNDNGPEFRGKNIQEIPVYYCDPLKPQQRGTIENTIGMLRRNIGRKTDLEKLGRKGIKAIERNFNLRPRKCLGYKTPFEVLYKQKVALAV